MDASDGHVLTPDRRPSLDSHSADRTREQFLWISQADAAAGLQSLSGETVDTKEQHGTQSDNTSNHRKDRGPDEEDYRQQLIALSYTDSPVTQPSGDVKLSGGPMVVDAEKAVKGLRPSDSEHASS